MNISRMSNIGTETSLVPKAARRGWLWPLASLRIQITGGLLFAVFLPAMLKPQIELQFVPASMENTAVGTAAALLIGAYFLRRMLPFPGVQGMAFVLPSFAISYVMVLSTFFFFRIEYSRLQFLISFLAAMLWFLWMSVLEKRYKRPRLSVVPGGNSYSLFRLGDADWYALQNPERLPRNSGGLVADLTADLSSEWEKFIASCALEGVPVYHSKHVAESLTGRVEIEHLSENSLGSLIPNSIYIRFKGLLDVLAVIVAVPVVAVLGAVVAMMVKLEDGGPVLFTQERMGFRGRTFRIYKFRTMRSVAGGGKHYTEGNDPRVTRVGRLLRRYRVDELPQIINILRGEMSWIGPRPESLPLSRWYETKIPFYSYRHIVRPGITGWAQVQQGWAAELDEVTGKLHYDFYYIKHFSPWLDALIIARTFRAVLTGFGAR